jgi:hypothetical protein
MLSKAIESKSKRPWSFAGLLGYFRRFSLFWAFIMDKMFKCFASAHPLILGISFPQKL